MKIAFQTFGCRRNRAEALDHEARYAAEGHEIVALDDACPPDVIVVRGCSVTAKAERDCRKAIAHLRARFPSARIEPTGCLTGASAASSEDAAPQTIPTRTARAYLKVQDGCSCKCAFCIVPSFRGPPKSVPFAQALSRAQAFFDAGYREIVVTGCNLALYRDAGHGLADLLASLADLPVRVRLSSLEPGVCDAAVLDAFADRPNICRFIHLSVQSGADRILKRMGRPYAIAAVDSFCDAALERLGPRIAIGADIITGFPGERDVDFAATRDFISHHPFSNLHVFPYSERPGTAAATMDNAVPVAVRRARAKELDTIGAAKRKAFAASFLGRTVEVCIEHGNTGWTAEYLKCAFPDTAVKLQRRSLAQGRVIDVEGDSLLADI